MTDSLHTYDRPLLSATHVERDSRFTILVDLDGEEERVFMADPGALRTVLEPGREVLLAAAANDDRKTDYDAVAVRTGEAWSASDSRAGNPRDADSSGGDHLHVPVVARLANDLFAAAVERGALPAFENRRVARREPPLPDGGRADFVLESVEEGTAEPPATTYVEVKSCTHVVDGVAKFPDRPTERGRRHLRSLADLVSSQGDTDAAVAFVVQRPDAERFAPYREVDPEFADLLAAVRDAGVGVHAVATAFEPPATRLVDPDLPVALD